MFDVELIRQDFPILARKINGKRLVYLDNAATTQKPRQVIEALVDFYENHNANIHRGIHTLAEEATVLYEKARQKVAKFIGGRVEEIIFVKNATEGLNLVASAYGNQLINRGEVILTTLAEHHSSFLPWLMLAKKQGAEMRLLDVDSQGRLRLEGDKPREEHGFTVGSLDGLLDKKVKVVAVAVKGNVLGTINPIEEIIRRVKRVNPRAVVVVDGSQSVPHRKTEVNKMKADFLAFSGHKMLGPMGSGVLWGRRALLEEMPPFLLGGEMIAEVKLSEVKWNQIPYKFEAGTPNAAGAVGLGAAVDYLEQVGMEAIEEHEAKLTRYGLEKLTELAEEGWVEIYGANKVEERIGVLTFNVRGVHAHDVAQVLDSEGVAIRSGHHCSQILTERLGAKATGRASFYLYNRNEEVDRLVLGLRKVKQVFG